jgi:hypothetical protein
MTKFREDDAMDSLRQKFFEGELPNPFHSTKSPTTSTINDFSTLTPVDRFHQIDGRLRRILVKACVNSYAATKVVNTLEEFLIRAHSGETDNITRGEWLEFLLEPPTAITRDRQCSSDVTSSSSSTSSESWITQYLFDADTSTGGFHRLLLHGVCQFHGLRPTTSSMHVMIGTETKKARVLTASGSLGRSMSKKVSLAEFIANQEASLVDGVLTNAALSNYNPLTDRLAKLNVYMNNQKTN